MKLARTVTLIAVVALFGVFGWMRFRGTADDPWIGGKRLSDWFRVLAKDEMVWSLQSGTRSRVFRGPEMGMAIEVFDHVGSRALPFLVREIVRSTRESPFAEFVEGVNSELPYRYRVPWIERRTRLEASFGLVKRLDLGVSDLQPAATSFLESKDTALRRAGIRLLGSARRDPEATARAMLPFLRSPDLGEVRVAVGCVAELGPPAAVVANELVRLATNSLKIHDLDRALGQCGPAASAALSSLEVEWNSTGERSRRLELGIVLCRIRPGHPEAWAFLESVASGEARKVPVRIQPVELARRIVRWETRDPQFLPLLHRILEEERQTTSTLLEVMEAIHLVDRSDAARRLEDLSRTIGVTNQFLGAQVCMRLLNCEPTHAYARTQMMARLSGNAWSEGIWAIRTLVSLGEAPGDIRGPLVRMIEDPRQHPAMRGDLRRYLRWIELRESLAAGRYGSNEIPATPALWK